MDTIRQKIERLNYKIYGFSDTIDKSSFIGSKIDFDEVGGGFLFGDRAATDLKVIHLFPHGGSTVPNWCLDFLDNVSEYTLAKLVVNNNDSCTTAIAKELLRRFKSSDKSFLTYFDLSRILVDANRGFSKEQVSTQVYKGQSILLEDKFSEYGEIIRSKYLLPWLNAVNDVIANNKQAIIFHHHTFDIKGASNLPHDKKPFSIRPPSQFFQTKPGLFGEENEKFIEDSLLYVAIEIAKKYLTSENINITIQVDDPLIAPIMPFRGCISNSYSNSSNPHIVYELRKDMLKTFSDVVSWVDCICEIQMEFFRLNEK